MRAGFLFEWLFAASPCLALALGAYLLLRREVASARYGRLWGLLFVFAVPIHALGYLMCAPASGQGWGFYLGEVLYAVLGTPVVIVLLGSTWAVLALRERPGARRKALHEVE